MSTCSSIRAQPSHSAATHTVSPWSVSYTKRAFDLAVALFALLLALPAMGLVAVLVKCSSRGPVLYRQTRVGRFGRSFVLLKFRTMRTAAGPLLTRAGDNRVTKIGKLLRHTKLDELPQLVNVIRGDMSLIGPRPDLPEFWSNVSKTHPDILRLRPGLTGAASLVYRNEERLLGQIEQDRVPQFYLSKLLPDKVRLDLEYASSATLASDLKLICATALSMWGPRRKNSYELSS